MPLVECKTGYATPSIAGNAYAFERDEYGRFVALVEHPGHLHCLLSVEHYRVVPEVPEPAADRDPAKPRSRRKDKAAEGATESDPQGDATGQAEDGAAAESDPQGGDAAAA